jgi:hypothetical protein
MADGGPKEIGSGSWRWIGSLVLLSILLVVMLYLLYAYPHQGIGPQQPIYFSHRIHSGVKQIDCRFCHPGVDYSQNAGIPTVQKCLYCHNYIVRLHPQLVKERWHYETKTPVPWVRIYYVADHVQFNHQPHIRKQIDCRVCHGYVERMDRLVQVNFKMGFCIGCHQQMNAQLDCWLACHH